MQKGLKIELNAAGYPDSLRGAFDGSTYFGNDDTGPAQVFFLSNYIERRNERLHIL